MGAWSWKRALLHAALAFIVAIVIGAAAFAAFGSPGSNARKAGEGVGRLAAFTAVVAFGVSWLHQLGRRKTAIGVVSGWVLLIGGAFAAAVLVKPRTAPATPLTAAERAPLIEVEEAGQHRLRHPTFGFSLRHPGRGFREAPEVAQAMTNGQTDPETQTYGFMDSATQSAFVVSVMNGMGGTRDKLAAHVDGVARGLGGSAAVGGGMRSDKRITWEDGRHVGRMSAVVAGDVHVELAAYSVEPPGRAPFIVNLMVTTRAPETFADVLASFRP